MKHFKQLSLIILTISLLLCGCGGTSDKDEYTLSEYLYNGEHIWYLTEGFGKDDAIEAIYVTEPDGTMYYCDTDWKLGEVEQKEDAEIIAYVKQAYEENMKEELNYALELEGKTNEFDQKLVSDMSSILSPYLDNIQPASWKLSIITDATGNYTAKEVFAFQQFAPHTFLFNLSQSIVNIELSCISSLGSEAPTSNCFQIYDSWYGGARVQSNTCNCPSVFSYHALCGNNCPRASIDTDFAYLLTRVDSNKLFKLDDVGTKNIGIDNADSLFDELIIDLKYENVETNY